MELDLEENLMRILMQDYINHSDGMFLSQIKEKLVLFGHKKFAPRLIQKFLNKEFLESIPYREGKVYYKKIRLSFEKYSEELKKELKKRRTKKKSDKEESSSSSELQRLLEKKYAGVLNYMSCSFEEKMEIPVFLEMLEIMKELDQKILSEELEKYNLADVFHFCIKNSAQIKSLDGFMY